MTDHNCAAECAVCSGEREALRLANRIIRNLRAELETAEETITELRLP